MPTDPETLEAEITSQEQALQAPVAQVRAAAAKRLGQLKAGAEALVNALQDSHEIVRVAAAMALGSIPREDETHHALILDQLLSAIDDPSDKVCQAALWSLGMRREISAADQIADLLTVSNPLIVGSAILALARIGDMRIAPDLLAYLAHPNEYVRTQAVRAVAFLRYTPAGPAILEMYARVKGRREQKGSPRHTLFNHLFEAMAALDLQEAVPILIETARQDVGLRGKAVETLIALQAEEAAAQLAPMLADPSASLRRNLLHLMGQFRYAPAIPLIRPLLHDNQPSIRRAALHVLTRLEDRESAGVIEWISFHDPNPFARVAAVHSLAHLLGADAQPALHALAGDLNVDVRRAVASSLLQINRWGENDLRIAARFAADFPNDEISQQLRGVLAQHPTVPDDQEPEPAPPSGLPPELAAERERLVDLLAGWHASLPAGSANEATRAALQHLLANLRDA